MNMTRLRTVLTGAALAIAAASVGPAEVTALRARAEVRIEEILTPDGDLNVARDSFPETSDLPIQVVARLEHDDPNQPAAAIVAAQFADPRPLRDENPQELAVNLALLSANPQIAYRAESTTVETRTVRLSRAGLTDRLGVPRRPVRGIVTLDGAVAIFAPTRGQDLSAAQVRVRIQIVQRDADGERTVLTAALAVRGTADGSTAFETLGDLPAERVLSLDLSAANPDFELFRVVVLPNIRIEYPYLAPTDETFELEAKLTVLARSAPGSGVAVVLGAPQQALRRVVETVKGQLAGQRFDQTLAKARAEAAGQSAPPAVDLTPLLPATCGPVGLLPLGLVGLALGQAKREAGAKRK